MSSGPDQPAYVDPVATASAQAQANAGTATAQTALNNANQVGPTGNLTYDVTGSQSFTNPDGTTSSVPTYTRTTTLSPGQQRLYDQQVGLGQQENYIAKNALTNISGVLSNPMQPGDAPALTTSVGTPTLATGYSSGSPIRSSYSSGSPIQSSYADGGTINNLYDLGGSIVNGYQRGGTIQSDVEYDLAGTDAHQNANAPTQFGQTRGQILSSLGNTDFAAERDAATNAVLQRLAPSIAARNESLSSTLANQGVTQNSAAWNAADLQNQGVTNDLQLGAVATGDAEQQALFGERLAGGQFQNAAQEQEYDQLLGRGQFAQAGIAQNNAANLNEARYGLDATTANNASRLNAGIFHNQAEAQGTSENAAAAAFSNNAQAQCNSQNAALAAFGNSAQAQRTAENAAAAGFGNAAQQQEYEQNQQGAAFSNAAQQQEYDQNRIAAGFGNDAASQDFQNRTAAAGFGNQAAAQSLQQQMAIRDAPLNEVGALMSGGQVSLPQFAGYSPGEIGQTPISADTYASANLAQQSYLAQMQAAAQENAGLYGLGSSLLGGIGKFAFSSDRRLKRDVQRIGAWLNGLPVYVFRYLWDAPDAPLRTGFMADEVRRLRPAAVLMQPDGFDMVDYALAASA